MTTPRVSAGDLLRSALSAAGVASVYGRPLPGFAVPVDDDGLAELLALADEHVHGAPAARHVGDQELRFGPAAPDPAPVVGDVGDVPGAVLDAVARRGSVRLDVDLGADADHVPVPVPVAASPWLPVDDAIVDAVRDAGSLLFLVGPGVLRDRAEDGLRALAAVLSVGVLNTWGAKGVFYWQSRHHLATIGLQAGDFTGSGLADVDLVVTSGLDTAEAPRDRWALAPSIDVPPRMLAPLAEVVSRPRVDIPFPPVRARLGAATAAGWESTSLPVAPTALTRGYSRVVGASGLVAADPGTAGFFVARTLPTEAPRTVSVPGAGGLEGFAVAACLAAGLRTPWRRRLAVVDGPLGNPSAQLLDVAARLAVPVVVETWSPDAPPVALDDHLAATASAMASPVPRVRAVAFDPSQLDAFVDAAGPIIAWR